MSAHVGEGPKRTLRLDALYPQRVALVATFVFQIALFCKPPGQVFPLSRSDRRCQTRVKSLVLRGSRIFSLASVRPRAASSHRQGHFLRIALQGSPGSPGSADVRSRKSPVAFPVLVCSLPAPNGLGTRSRVQLSTQRDL